MHTTYGSFVFVFVVFIFLVMSPNSNVSPPQALGKKTSLPAVNSPKPKSPSKPPPSSSVPSPGPLKPSNRLNLSVLISRFAFVFLAYALITSGYITETLSCQMRKYLHETHYGRHVFGIIMILAFIMFEGGWSFDQDLDKAAENDWASGNVLSSIVWAATIYLIFLISSKSRLIPNLLFFFTIFLVYCINTQRCYWKERNLISAKMDERILAFCRYLILVAAVILIYGFIDYVIYQRQDRPGTFSWSKFIFSTGHCSSIDK